MELGGLLGAVPGVPVFGFGAAEDAGAHAEEAQEATGCVDRGKAFDVPGTKLVGDITFLPTARAGSTSPAGWTPTREVIGYAMADPIAPNSSWTPWTWPTDGVGWSLTA
ncbi:hypothetical protein GCM10010390_64600 [Streptomyces mordarskii]|uniref:Uncharacterized protein n=1 Tax=Streptomyces mordarskii TaxID=1226758 RepID=A0ABP3NUG4_9ACTN